MPNLFCTHSAVSGRKSTFVTLFSETAEAALKIFTPDTDNFISKTYRELHKFMAKTEN
jgi:hypothetical protein